MATSWRWWQCTHYERGRREVDHSAQTNICEVSRWRITPEAPAKGESQSNDAVEYAGQAFRERSTVMKEQVEDKVKIALQTKTQLSEGLDDYMVRNADLSHQCRP